MCCTAVIRVIISVELELQRSAEPVTELLVRRFHPLLAGDKLRFTVIIFCTVDPPSPASRSMNLLQLLLNFGRLQMVGEC